MIDDGKERSILLIRLKINYLDTVQSQPRFITLQSILLPFPSLFQEKRTPKSSLAIVSYLPSHNHRQLSVPLLSLLSPAHARFSMSRASGVIDDGYAEEIFCRGKEGQEGLGIEVRVWFALKV